MRRNGKQEGQVLAQVALMLVVLLGFLALAVDVSQVYLKRRQLQNAADAAALESARWICFVDETDSGGATNAAEAMAAAQFSDPSGVGVDVTFPGPIDYYTTTVVVTQTIPSFVASIVGQDLFNPGARATAVCGAADRGVGNIWPVTMNVADWDTIACDSPFTAWKAGNDPVDCNTCNCNTVFADGNNPTQLCVPDPTVLHNLMTVGVPLTIGSGQSGWLNLFDPQPPLPLPTCNYENCGADGVACYIEQTHPGPVNVCDLLGNKSGTVQFNSNIKDAVCDHARQQTRLSMPLWSDDYSSLCPALNPVIGNCGTASPYPVVDFGCLEILGYSTEAWVPYADSSTLGRCEEHLTVIFARKKCEGCNSFQGGAGSGPPGDGVRAVSLIE